MARRRGARPTVSASDIAGTGDDVDGSGVGGSGVDAGDVVNPATVTGDATTVPDGGAGNSERPRRKYTRRGGAAKAQALPVSTLSFLLMSSHAMLAGMTKTPELELADEEATNLGTAIATVNSFYNVAVADKTMAWIALAMVAGQVYGPRVMAIGIRRRSERAERVTMPERPVRHDAPIATEAFIQPVPMERPEDIFDGGEPREWMNGGASVFSPGLGGMGPVN